MTAERQAHVRGVAANRPQYALYPAGLRVSQSLQMQRPDKARPAPTSVTVCKRGRHQGLGKGAVVSVVSVRVRITDFLTDRRYAICVDRPGHRAWVLPLAAARKLHHDLGEALEAVDRLGPFNSGLVGEPVMQAQLAGESAR
jgi:hypothetical protein